MHLGLEKFSETVHIIAPIGATFLRQRAAQMKASSKHPRAETSGIAPPPPSSTGDTSVEASVDPAIVAIPSPSTLDDSNIRRMLKTVMIVQAAHGQILVDMLDELRSLQANLESFRRSPSPPPFDDEL